MKKYCKHFNFYRELQKLYQIPANSELFIGLILYIDNNSYEYKLSKNIMVS